MHSVRSGGNNLSDQGPTELDGGIPLRFPEKTLVHINPGTKISKDFFQRKMPRFSVSLPGLIDSGPFFDEKGPQQNFGYDAPVDPIATRSGSFQLWVALKMGFSHTFLREGAPPLNIFVRHCDPDIALSVWLLKNHKAIHDPKCNAQIERLVFAVDDMHLQAHAEGQFVERNSLLMRKIGWIFEPCQSPPSIEDSSELHSSLIESAINDVGNRISGFVEGWTNDPLLTGALRIFARRPNSPDTTGQSVDPIGSLRLRSEPSCLGHEADLGQFCKRIHDQVYLNVIPRAVFSWEEFQVFAPSFSVALDGIVRGRPRFLRRESDGALYQNFNHHEEVDRLATFSTCAQVFRSIKSGLFEVFREHGFPRMNIFVNDPDEDVALSVWLLKNHELVSDSRYRRKIERLVRVCDLLDATAGAFPVDPTHKSIRAAAWIFEPFKAARTSGSIPHMTGEQMAALIDHVGDRIGRFVRNSGEKRALDDRYEVVGGGEGWSLIREVGSEGRMGFFSDGGKAFISFREDADKPGIYAYSVSKLSPYIDFPIEELYSVLNKAEGLKDGSKNSWGGSDIVGGSPRMSGSHLTPQDVERIVNSFIVQGRSKTREAH